MQNKRIAWIVIAGLLLCTFVLADPAQASGPVYHTVRPGQTLYSIAAMYGVSPWAITFSNRLVGPSGLRVGQVLIIPASSAPVYGYGYAYANPFASPYATRYSAYAYPYYRAPAPVQPQRVVPPLANPVVVSPPSAPLAPSINLPYAQSFSPTGSDSSNPANFANTWQTLNPGASVWVRLGSGGNRIVASLGANSLNGLSMQVYAPGIFDHPIGQGTYENSSGRLTWAGGKWNSSGDWLARITNSASSPITYYLSVTATEIGQCDSISYWEKIGTADVYWTRCK